MDVNKVITLIPSFIASLYEKIYVLDKSNNNYYEIKYTGEKMTVSHPYNYLDIKSEFSSFKEDILSNIEANEDFKKVYKSEDGLEKLITLITHEGIKLIFINDITFKMSENSIKNKLLIADDSPVITNFFSRLFKDDFEVLICKDGDEVIDNVNKYKDSILGVFLDLNMPKKDGFEVLEYFKENNLFKVIPVSVISGEDTQDGIEKALTYDVVDMLQKPFSADNARMIVNKTINVGKN